MSCCFMLGRIALLWTWSIWQLIAQLHLYLSCLSPTCEAVGHNTATHPACILSCRPIPTLLRFHGALGVTAEAVLAAVVVSGWFLSAAAACGATHPLVFGALWLLYLSFVSLGGSFVEYGCVYRTRS